LPWYFKLRLLIFQASKKLQDMYQGNGRRVLTGMVAKTILAFHPKASNFYLLWKVF